MGRKSTVALLIILFFLPLFYWSRIAGILILLLEVVLILLHKRQTVFVKIFISLLICFYSYWIYFNLSGFLMTHYFSIKQLVTEINQTDSKIFDVNNSSSDDKKTTILNEMKRLGFYYSQIDANNDKITFSIKGTYWTGKESAENAFVYTDFTFFAATSYPTVIYINSYDD